MTPGGAWTHRPPAPVELTALVDACTAADGVAPLSGHVLDQVRHQVAHPGSAESADTGYLCVRRGNRLIGLAVSPGPDPAELAVVPDARGRGTGAGLLEAVLERTDRVWAHGDLPAARALARSCGLRPVRTLHQMRRPTGDLPDAALPDGIELRTFRPGDEDALLAVNARAFAWHPEQGRLDRAGLATEMEQPWFDPAGLFLAVDAQGRVHGFHWTKLHGGGGVQATAPDTDPTAAHPTASATDPGGPIGEVYVLGVDPESPVRRLGAPLTVAGLVHLRERGASTVMLYVEGDNDRALALYRRLGFTIHLTDRVYARTGSA